MVRRQVLKALRRAVRPADGCANTGLSFTETKEKLLGVLRQESRARLQILRLAMRSDLDCDRSSYRITIAFRAAQSESNRVADLFHGVAQNAELRRVPILEDDLESPIVVQVGQHKRAAVIGKIQPGCAGDIGECTVVIVPKEHVSLGPAPRRVRTNEFIDCIPSLFVVRGWHRVRS